MISITIHGFNSNPFDPDEMCPKKLPAYAQMMKEFYKHKFPPQFIRNLMMFKDNISADESENCKKNIQYRAEVTFQLATNEMPVTVISRRLSFFDKLSGFGKIYFLLFRLILSNFFSQEEFWDCLLE